jgi:uncharacterized iron-regulated membrane protein
MTTTTSRRPWLDRRTVWRWHFYAALFCIPFVIVLSLSGAIYLFKAEVESWLERPYDRLAAAGPPQTAAARVAAASAAVPGATFKSYELPGPPRDGAGFVPATRVILDRDGEAVRAYVHPTTLDVLAVLPERDRFMRQVARLHGELLLGDAGSMIVELAASWAVVMILTGLWLWWPRQARSLAGVVYPRLRGGPRVFWLDLHAVTGVWISACALFLLVSGLPWATSWGAYLKLARRLTGTAAAQDWNSGRAAQAGHGDHDHGDRAAGDVDLAALDRVATAAAALRFEPPVTITPQRGDRGTWTVKSETQNRPRRAEAVVDGASGAVVSRKDFRDRHVIDRVVGYGIAAHEGRLFGWPNQVLGLLTACGLVLVSASGAAMWWRRRQPGTLGAPPAAGAEGGRGAVVVGSAVLVLGIWLPLFGASLAAVLVVERFVLRRVPALAAWLGLD